MDDTWRLPNSQKRRSSAPDVLEKRLDTHDARALSLSLSLDLSEQGKKEDGKEEKLPWKRWLRPGFEEHGGFGGMLLVFAWHAREHCFF